MSRRARALAFAVLLTGCAHTEAAQLPRAMPSAFAVPRDVAGAVAWDPTRVEGQVFAVIFFATWCFPCLTELGVMQKLQAELGAQGFTSVAVGMDLEGHRVLDPFAQAMPGAVPIVVADEALRRGESPYGPVKELPTRFLFDRDGQLIAAWSGAADPSKLRALVQKALAAKRQ